MKPSRESSRRQVPDSVWWCIVFAAYSWGYSEGRRAGWVECSVKTSRAYMTQPEKSDSEPVDVDLRSTVYEAAICPECGGWNAWHFHEGVGGMWHDHDGRRVDFVKVELVAYNWAMNEVDQWAGS